MNAAAAADTLHLTVQLDRFDPRLQVVVNGQNLLDSQRPLGQSGRPMMFIPTSCASVLPPDVGAMLPTARPTQAMVGVCNCGEAGCNSLWLQVRRCGDRVVWEPDYASPRRTVDRSWSFDLLPYLQTIDDAVAANARLETRAHAIARELRRRRDSLFGFGMNTRVQLFDLRAAYAAWDSSDLDAGPHLGIRVAGVDGMNHYLIPLPETRSDDEILTELHNFHPERYKHDSQTPWIRNPPFPPPGTRRRNERARD